MTTKLDAAGGARHSVRAGVGLALLIAAAAIAGCGGQRGRFVTTGVTSYTFASPAGVVDVVNGFEAKPPQTANGTNEQHLLYLLILTPAQQERGSKSSSDFGQYVTALNHEWDTEKGAFAVAISWNRKTDAIAVGNQQFDRANGNVFIVRVGAAGTVSGEQFVGLGQQADADDMLGYLRKQVPKDQAVASVKLLK